MHFANHVSRGLRQPVTNDGNGAERTGIREVASSLLPSARLPETRCARVEDAVLPEYVDRIKSNMRTVVQSKAPIYDAFPMPHPKRDFIHTERIYFPLASDGELVDMILIVNGYPDLRE
jgi:hypothetical protein